MKGLIAVPVRLFAFLGKELVETIRRPGALVSLVLGPFLIMAIFGLGYDGYRNPLRTVVVAAARDGPSAEPFGLRGDRRRRPHGHRGDRGPREGPAATGQPAGRGRDRRPRERRGALPRRRAVGHRRRGQHRRPGAGSVRGVRRAVAGDRGEPRDHRTGRRGGPGLRGRGRRSRSSRRSRRRSSPRRPGPS